VLLLLLPNKSASSNHLFKSSMSALNSCRCARRPKTCLLDIHVKEEESKAGIVYLVRIASCPCGYNPDAMQRESCHRDCLQGNKVGKTSTEVAIGANLGGTLTYKNAVVCAWLLFRTSVKSTFHMFEINLSHDFCILGRV
jgi:hypothetical protein